MKTKYCAFDKTRKCDNGCVAYSEIETYEEKIRVCCQRTRGSLSYIKEE